MSPKWSWLTGIATLLALALSVVFFVATQSITQRDWIVIIIGILVGGAATAFVATFIFHSDSRKEKQTAEANVASSMADTMLQREQKITTTMGLIPSRQTRLEELQEEILELKIAVSNSQGNAAVGMAQARDATNHGYIDMALENKTAAQSWILNSEARTAELSRRENELGRVEALSDAEWKAEQVQLRFIGPENIRNELK